jgi:hypothetical protein
MIGIQRIWKVKTNVIPVIIRATGTISESLRYYLSNIPRNHEIAKKKKKKQHH